MKHYNPQPFNWGHGFETFGVIAGLLLAFALVMALLYQILARLSGDKHAGIGAYFANIRDGLQDLLLMSPRRVGAMAVLVFREAWRRKTFGVLVIFGILFLFAGWFLSDPNRDSLLRVPIYVTFVLTAMSWLILPSVFLFSCWGLPDDIKARSLHTVVTKPIRRSEILVGRIAGVTLVGTVALVAMSIIGYLWLLRALPEVRGMKTRVPVFGSIAFLDREGEPAKEGINVGDIDMFRSYIEGDTKARAIWTFDGVSPRLLDKDGKLNLESKIQGFRTHKGNIEKGIIFQYTFVNPTRKIRAKYQPLEIAEFRDLIRPVENELIDDQNRPVKLMTDLVDNGKLTIEVACLSSGQFLGMARPDLFIRAQDATFAGSYFKAAFCIWLMMVLIIVMAVSVSTIVKGPVTAFLTFVIIILGTFGRDFMLEITDAKKWQGGGLIESVYRILTHLNPNVPMPEGRWTTIIQVLDRPLLLFAGNSRAVIPDMSTFQMAKVVADGYDVPWNSALLPAIMHLLAFAIPCIVLGYFCLKNRELESK